MPFKAERQEMVSVGPFKRILPRGTMPPGEIMLWNGNPRIRHKLAKVEGYPTDEDLMWAIKDVQKHAYGNLAGHIKRYGQQEPVFLRPNGGSRSPRSATVIEGNTRVAIIKKLHEANPHDERFQTVQAYLLPADIGEEDLATLMATYHVTGTLRNQWDRYQIGAFLYEHIEEKENFTQAGLASIVSKSTSWVSRLLAAYRFAVDYQDFIEAEFNIESAEAEDEATRKFSMLEEAWKVKPFRDEMERSTAAKETLFRWVHEGKFTDHRNVRAIHELYSDPAVRRAIDKGGALVADQIASERAKSIPLHDDLDRLERRIKGLAFADLERVDPERVQATRAALERLEAMVAKARPL